MILSKSYFITFFFVQVITRCPKTNQVPLAVLDVIEQENLIENAAQVGNFLITELKKFPQIKDVRGRGLMIGLEFEEPIKELRSRLIYDEHVFTGASGTNVLRLLPPLCLTMEEAEDFLARFKKVL